MARNRGPNTDPRRVGRLRYRALPAVPGDDEAYYQGLRLALWTEQVVCYALHVVTSPNIQTEALVLGGLVEGFAEQTGLAVKHGDATFALPRRLLRYLAGEVNELLETVMRCERLNNARRRTVGLAMTDVFRGVR